MKIFLHTLALTVVLLSALLPAASVFAYAEQSPVEPATVFVPQGDELPLEPYWDCVYGPGGSPAQCPVPSESTPTMIFDYTGSPQGGLARANIICSVEDCPTLAYYVYVKISWRLDYSSSGNTPNNNYNLVISTNTPSSAKNYTYAETIICPASAGNHTCQYDLYLPIKKAQVSDWNGNPVSLEVNAYAAGGPDGGQVYLTSATLQTVIELSFIAPSCDERFTIIENIIDTEIDEKIEMPLGPEAVEPDLPDNQKIPMTAGNFYRLETDGGPWRDEDPDEVNRYDTEVSFDEGVTWLALDEIDYVCIEAKVPEPDLMIVFFIAPEGTEYFMIRVPDGIYEDWSNNWLPNEASPMHYKLDLAFEYVPSCATQFTFSEDDWVASLTVQANDAVGVQALHDFTVGGWYAIEIVAGQWYDNESPETPRKDGQYNFWSMIGPSYDWTAIGSEADDLEGLTECVTSNENGYSTAYVQAGGSFLKLRVNDVNETFELNTGALSFNIYETTYNRAPSQCEAPFQINDLVKADSIDAKMQNGSFVGQTSTPPNPGNPLDPINEVIIPGGLALERWYMIETKSGPWSNGLDFFYDLAIQVAGGTWTPLSDWAEAECVTPIDNLGHVRAYFKTPMLAAVSYRLRVNDTEGQFGNNAYGMDYDLYTIIDNSEGVMPGVCGISYDENSPLGDITIQANNSSGVNVPSMTQDGYYVLMFDGGPWKEVWNEVDKYGVQISDDGGTTWTPLGDYGGLVCFRSEDDPTILYYYINSHSTQTYKVRVDSDSFADNVGTQHLVVFAGFGDNNEWTSCLSGVTKYKIDAFDPIPVNYEPGVRMPLEVGKTYIVALKGGPWMDDDTPSGDAEVTSDGAAWYSFGSHPSVTCSVLDMLGKQWIMFTVQSGDVWNIRADDSGDGYDNNYTNVPFGYELWTTDPSDAGVDIGDYFIEYCSMGCIRPGAVETLPSPEGIDVSEWIGWMAGNLNALIGWVGTWIDYATCNVGVYFSFCPRHTEALLAVLGMFESTEPTHSIRLIIKVVQAVRQEVDSYAWLNEGGGGDDPSESSVPESILAAENYNLDGVGGDQLSGNVPRNRIAEILLPGLPPNSPWNGGGITLRGESTATTACNHEMQAAVGILLSRGVCFASNHLRSTGIAIWMQILFDLSVLAGLTLYLGNVWVKPLTK